MYEPTKNDDALKAVKSADRVLDLFELLSEWGRGPTHTEIAERLGIPKSSLSQLLKNLVSRDYVSLDGAERRYKLGGKFKLLAQRVEDRQDLTAAVQPFLERISQATRETSFLNILSGDHAQLTARSIGPQPLVAMLEVGQLIPLYRSAGGRAILAFLPDSFREDYTSRVVKSGSLTQQQADELRGRLDQVRQDSYSVSRDEFSHGISGVAVPLLSRSGVSIGSLIVSMPTSRFSVKSEREILSVLRTNASALVNQLGL